MVRQCTLGSQDYFDHRRSLRTPVAREEGRESFSEVTKRLAKERVKFLLRRFLYVNYLSGYGVLDTAGSFEIVRIKPQTGEEGGKL